MNLVKLSGRSLFLPLFLFVIGLGWLSSALVTMAQQGNACAAAPTADPSATVCVSEVLVSFNGVSPDNQFFVSWRSQKSEKGQVQLADGEVFEDVRGANYSGKTHYVQVNNLGAKTNYTFDIVSGGNTYTNGGAHWSIRTGPALQSGTPYVVFGRVQNPDGSDADGAVVLAQVRDTDDQGTQGRSTLLSGIIDVADGGNYFTINLDDARNQSNNQKFVYDPAVDRVAITVIGAQGTVNKVFNISDLHPPKPPSSLILGSNGTGAALTATATLPIPTSTPTLSPSPTLTPTETIAPPTPSTTPLPPTATPLPSATLVAIPAYNNPIPTLSSAQATDIAENPLATNTATPAEVGIETEPTRVSRGVPALVPPPPPADNTLFIVSLAVALIVGALLLGLAGYFVLRR